jgi:hypothetical protein
MGVKAHTPGPWRAERGNAGAEHPLFVTAEGKDGFRPWCDDDARLIAAAPDGYALAKLVVEFFGTDPIEDLLDADIRLRGAAVALIAKAEGREP